VGKRTMAEHNLASICTVLFSWIHPCRPISGQVFETGSRGRTPIHSGNWRTNCGRRAAGSVSGSDAQNHLAAGAARGINKATTDEQSPDSRPAPPIRIRNITFVDPDGSWPIAWERARGVHVWDADGKQYLDLTAHLVSLPAMAVRMF